MNLFTKRYRLNRIFRRLHRILFELFVLGAIGTAAIAYVRTKTIEAALNGLWHPFVVYVLLCLILLLLHVLVAYPFRLRLYYNIWLAKAVPKLQEIRKQDKHFAARYIADRLVGNLHANTFRIIKSRNENMVADVIPGDRHKDVWKRKEGLPVFIRREDLMSKRFWPDWAFSVVILFNAITLTKQVLGTRQIFKLQVDLRDQSYGIYNNAGKSFLKSEWGEKDEFIDRCLERSKRINDFFQNPKIGKLSLSCERLPLRWASGGILPIVRWREKKWFALFFRDLNPVGWNVANGASETKEEYKDFSKLAAREFGEELLVLSEPPGDSTYFPPDFPDAETMPKKYKFTKEHFRLRALHDNIWITQSLEDLVKIYILDTPFRLSVDYHSRSFRNLHKEFHDILFQINPYEFGIEILEVCEFELPDDGYLLDGEIWTLNYRSLLLRRPIILFNVESLRRIFEDNNRSLGSLRMDQSHLECKLLYESLDHDDFYLFEADIFLKERRLNNLKKSLEPDRQFELERFEDWFTRFGEQFYGVISKKRLNRYEHTDLLTLCPVSWKAIEQVFEYGLL